MWHRASSLASSDAAALSKWLVAVCPILLLASAVRVASSDPEEACERRSTSCIQCSTEPSAGGWHPCGDPFDGQLHKELKKRSALSKGTEVVRDNATVSVVHCDGLCVKWVRIPPSGGGGGSGGASVTRTCSASLDLKFTQTASVCIYESRSGSGHMCFCKGSLCNSAAGRHSWWSSCYTAYCVTNALLLLAYVSVHM